MIDEEILTFFNNQDNSSTINYQPTFNPIDKVMELYEQIIKEKNELIEKLLNK